MHGQKKTSNHSRVAAACKVRSVYSICAPFSKYC